MKILMSDDFQYLEGKNDIDRILFSKNEKILTKEIKYYVLKLCNTLLEEKNKNYETFLNYFKEILNIDNKIEYFKDINLNDNKIFFYSMIPLINKDNTFLLLFKGNEKLNQFQAYKDLYESIINKIKNKEAMNDVIIPRELSDYKIKDVYYKQLRTYLKLLGKNEGLLINFGEYDLKKGMRRVTVNEYRKYLRGTVAMVPFSIPQGLDLSTT